MNILLNGLRQEENPDVLMFLEELFDLYEYILQEEDIFHQMITDSLILKINIISENFKEKFKNIIKSITIQKSERLGTGDIDIIFELTDDYYEHAFKLFRNSNKQVRVVYVSPMYYISRGTRYSHATHELSDTLIDTSSDCKYPIGDKDYDLVRRIGVHMNHESVLEHSLLIFDVKMSTKALLEESRHRIGVSQTVTSSRYALRKVNILFEKTKNPIVNSLLKDIKKLITDVLTQYDKKDVSDDDLAMALPQSFIYELQLTFNLRSLRHFLHLRLPKSAHRTIRKVAVNILDELKNKHEDYFKLLMEDENIKKHYYAKYNDEFRDNLYLNLLDDSE